MLFLPEIFNSDHFQSLLYFFERGRGKNTLFFIILKYFRIKIFKTAKKNKGGEEFERGSSEMDSGHQSYKGSTQPAKKFRNQTKTDR